ncbi:DNA-binding MarR family transcriptional regulator [Paraburkholderia sp. WC7.3d]
MNESKIMSEGVYGEQATGRVTHSLLRLSTAMRSQAWEWAEGAGLTPTQGEILVLLMQRKGPMRLGEIARETALTAATTSDAVSTLETKGLVEKRRALDDGRALAVRLTARGRTAAKRAVQWPDFLSKAVGTLRDDEQAVFYRTLLKTIYQLEAQNTIPSHRMCLNCTHFQPSKNPKKTPHHCALLDLNMADTDLRLDCSVHETADVATQKKTWKIFVQ